MALITSKSRVKLKYSAGKRQEDAKKSREEELDDVCVVGYACKLFRDDPRAREIDRGGHLIPWMGDKTLMIDRYDGRGHLHDLSEFDRAGWNEETHLSAEAARIEAICDEERYMALHTDLLEEQTRQEEELKRLNEAITSDKGYSAVEFEYGAGNEDYDPMQPTEDENEAAQRKLVSHENQPPPSYQHEETTPASDLEEPFVAPPELKLPPGIEQPQTWKMHVIIEKTAMFVCNHGPQMEIIVKTKQANNPQFDFIQFDHFLNPYYKHLLSAIKTKKYIPTAQRAPSQPEKKKQGEINSRRSSNSNSVQSDDDEDDMEGSGYLHPSLFAPPRPKPAAAQVQPHPPSGPLQPDHIPPPVGPIQGELFLMDPQQQQQQQLVGYYAGPPVTTTAPFHLPPLLVPPPPPPDHSNSAGNPVPISHTLGPLPPGYLAAEPLPGPVLPPHHPALVPPIHEGQPLPLTAPSSMLGPPLISQEMPPAADESAIGTQRPPIVPPPPDIQPIIDKLAKYVAKNGEEFEASVRDKHDPRFEFLVPWHNYNAYYLAKKDMFLQEFRQREEGADAADAENRNAAEKQKKVPVRFPIKPKRAEERTLERRSALPLESSSDSEEEGEGDESTSGSHRRTTARAGDFPAGGQRGFPPELQRGFPPEQRGFPPRQQMDWPMEEGRVGGGGEGREWTAMGQEGGMDPSYVRAMEAQGRLGVQQFMGEEDATTQSRRYGSAYGEDQGNGREGGFADDGRESTRTTGSQPCLEDRLAAAARKKLASASQERSLQVERRKKLALFLNQVKDRPQAAAAAQESGVTDSERDDFERGRLLGRPRSPSGSNRGEQAQSAGVSRSAMYGDSRGGKRAPPVPKSYQTAVNRGAVERRRKRRSRSRSPSPRRSRKMSPAPISTIVPSTSAIMGRASSASPPMMEVYQEREMSVSSPSSEPGVRLGSIQPSSLELKTESKTSTSGLRAKVRAMLAATRGMPSEGSG